MEEALHLVAKTGNRKALSDIYRCAADLHLDIVSKEVNKNQKPSDAVLEKALNIVGECLAVYQELSDDAGQAQMWGRISNMHVMMKDGEAALAAGKESLRLCEKQEGKLPRDEAQALLT